jgi:zinc/manganese transport system ATP-binding protein
MGYGIKIDRLNVQLGGERVLQDLSFTVQPGEFVGIIGPNGAGKTTLLRALLGMIKITSGTITGQGIDNLASGASLFGYAPQSRQIDAEIPLRAWDFVGFGLPHRFRPWLTKQDKKTVEKAMQATDSLQFAGKPIGKLSGGERQRLFLAQALVRNPQILLLDEPTASLDPGAQENLAAMVSHLNREQGIGVLFVSHDVNLIAKYADRILYITKGQYAIGTVKQVLQTKVLSRLYGSPVEVVRIGSKVVVSVGASDTLTTSMCLHNHCGQEELSDVSL